MLSSSSTSGKLIKAGEQWFVVLMEDNHPVKIIDWHTWLTTPLDRRPDNAYMVFGKDEMDAFSRALRGELLTY